MEAVVLGAFVQVTVSDFCESIEVLLSRAEDFARRLSHSFGLVELGNDLVNLVPGGAASDFLGELLLVVLGSKVLEVLDHSAVAALLVCGLTQVGLFVDIRFFRGIYLAQDWELVEEEAHVSVSEGQRVWAQSELVEHQLLLSEVREQLPQAGQLLLGDRLFARGLLLRC